MEDEANRLINDQIDKLTKDLLYFREKNAVKKNFYEGKKLFNNLRIAIPKQLEGLNTAVSWCNVVVERLNERINLNGFQTPEDLKDDVDDIYTQNYLDLKSSMLHRDALIYGVGYLLAGEGNIEEGEPDVIISIESPNLAIGTSNSFSGRLENFLKIIIEDNKLISGSYYTLNEIYYFDYKAQPNLLLTPAGTYTSSEIRVTSVVEHNQGFVPAVKVVNKTIGSDEAGESEISRSIMAFTEKAVRTYTNAEVSSEAYATPQKYFLNVDTTVFKETSAWESYITKVIAIGKNKDGSNPVVGQFSASSPAPYLDLIDGYTREISRETGIPLSNLGLNSANPSSADAIERELEVLIKRAEDRMKGFSLGWIKIIEHALTIRNGVRPDTSNSIRVDWRNAGTPSLSAAADAAFKLIDKNVIPAQSVVTWKRLGFTSTEIKQLEADFAAGSVLANSLTSIADQLKTNNAALADYSAQE